MRYPLPLDVEARLKKMSSTAYKFRRVVYLYRWTLSKTPFYVGSTQDIKIRDQQHKRYGSGYYSDRIIKSFGEKALSLEILETVTGTNKKDVWAESLRLENKYITQYRTLVQDGGGNSGLNIIKDESSLGTISVGSVLPFVIGEELRRLAVERNLSMSDLLRSIILEFLAQKPKK